MSSVQRAAVLVVGVLVLVGIVVVAVALGGDGIAGDADGSATPAASAHATATAGGSGPASPTAAASAPADDELLSALAEIEEQVIAIRGLERPEIGPPEIITRDEAREEFEQLFAEEYPPEERERDNTSLRALGLIRPDQDVVELQLQLLGDQVLGFYNDVDRRMVVVSDTGLDVTARVTYAHEYAHALQDAAFGLDTLETDAIGEDDRTLARTALIEGDATVAMLAWAFEHLSPEELLEVGTGTEIPDTTGIPSWMVNQLQWPYTAGQLWVGTLAGDPFAPDFDAVDAAYANPPDSTEQVVDLEAWETREPPVEVEAANLPAVLGDGWEEVETNTIGQALIGIILEHFEVPRAVATEAADGWGGDRAAIATGPDDAFAVSWLLRWDTATDAEEFVAAYEQAIEALAFPAVVHAVGDDGALVVHGSTDEIVEAVAAGAGVIAD